MLFLEKRGFKMLIKKQEAEFEEFKDDLSDQEGWIHDLQIENGCLWLKFDELKKEYGKMREENIVVNARVDILSKMLEDLQAGK